MRCVRVEHSFRFWDELGEICAFIARDSIYQAEKFEQELLDELEKHVGANPYGFRPSIYVNNPFVRDYVSKKRYVIPYEINEAKKIVTTLGIFKHNLWWL